MYLHWQVSFSHEENRARVIRCTAFIAAIGMLLLWSPSRAWAQTPSDSAWAARLTTAWQRAWSRDWSAADETFTELHRERPRAIEPILGLGFVARAEGRASDARRWYAEALAIDPSSSEARDQLTVAQWDRPFSVDLYAGGTRAPGVTTSTWSATAVAPLGPRFTATTRVGVIGGGDPLRGIFLDSTSGGGVRATVISLGGAARLSNDLTLTARGEHWSAGGPDQQFLWVDGAVRVSSDLTLHLATRPVSGSTGATQLGGGFDYAFGTKQIVSFDVMRGTRAAPFEARTIARGFLTATANVRTLIRLGAVRDIDSRLGATTGVASATWFARPELGVRGELSVRRGAFEQTSLGAAVVVRR
jgi:hypothetical protein